MKKPRILAMNAFYLPGFKAGGSIRALVNVVGHLRADFDFVVATGSHDLCEAAPYSTEAQADVIASEGYDIRYLPKGGPSLVLGIKRVLAEDWDMIYLNSSFSLGFSIFPMILRILMRKRRIPMVVAPRGELMSGALGRGAGKLFKKKVFLSIARGIGYFSGVTFHATSQEELEGIRSLRLGESRIVLAPDLPPLVGTEIALGTPKEGGKLRLVFISRIDAKKNLHFILELLNKVKAQVSLDIVGPIADAAYWASCQPLIAGLPAHIQVHYLGSIPHSQILQAFSTHDLFFFPTHAENNGYVILEALLAGCPVLLSDRTPWRGLQELGVGADFPLESPENFLEALESFANMSPELHATYRERAQRYGRERLSSSEDVSATRNLFNEAMGLNGAGVNASGQ